MGTHAPYLWQRANLNRAHLAQGLMENERPSKNFVNGEEGTSSLGRMYLSKGLRNMFQETGILKQNRNNMTSTKQEQKATGREKRRIKRQQIEPF